MTPVRPSRKEAGAGVPGVLVADFHDTVSREGATTVDQETALHYITLHYNTLHYTTLHRRPGDGVTLHSTT